jgi:hypothetical protein
VARYATPSGGWVREHYLVSPADAASAADYRTEICWPIEAGRTEGVPR